MGKQGEKKGNKDDFQLDIEGNGLFDNDIFGTDDRYASTPAEAIVGEDVVRVAQSVPSKIPGFDEEVTAEGIDMLLKL